MYRQIDIQIIRYKQLQERLYTQVDINRLESMSIEWDRYDPTGIDYKREKSIGSQINQKGFKVKDE